MVGVCGVNFCRGLCAAFLLGCAAQGCLYHLWASGTCLLWDRDGRPSTSICADALIRRCCIHDHALVYDVARIVLCAASIEGTWSNMIRIHLSHLPASGCIVCTSVHFNVCLYFCATCSTSFQACTVCIPAWIQNVPDVGGSICLTKSN